jgi:dTDP-4-dehydrorhamnose 3,5-epimerase
MLRGAKKDGRLVDSSWQKPRDLIDGLIVREVLHVPGDRGVLTEVYRPEWDPEGGPVGQVFQVRLFPGAVSAWHCHLDATDRLFALSGHVRVALFDDREDSRTRGVVNEFHVGESRPTLLVVPPRVWHGVQNLGGSECAILNCPSHPYRYDDPDHWRVPADCGDIPFSWKR